MSDTPNTTTDPLLIPDNSSFRSKFAHFLTRTETAYAKSPHSILTDRGIENRFMQNLVAHLPEGAMIGGGFLTNVITEEDKATDIDFFFTSHAAFQAMVRVIQGASLTGKWKEVVGDEIEFTAGDEKSAWAYQGYTLKEPINLDETADLRFITFVHPTRPALQLLRMVWYDSPEHVIDSFDFTVVQFVADSKAFYYNPVAFIDLSRKRLVMHRCQFASSSLRRLIKYASKGFYACPGSLAHIAEEIQRFKGPMDASSVVYVD